MKLIFDGLTLTQLTHSLTPLYTFSPVFYNEMKLIFDSVTLTQLTFSLTPLYTTLPPMSTSLYSQVMRRDSNMCYTLPPFLINIKA